ncbi:MAG: ABC transporter ATP-binding protein [Gemmatimonadales bacterium]|nr:MAG: ABC transporter ATP-binding protein [Gemmatimonadales bacterium]
MIRARGLTKRYGAQAVLDRVDMEVKSGERVALLGLNGAGKTTLIRCLLGLVPFEGRLEVAGFDVARHGRAVRERVGYVPQRVPWLDGSLAEMVEFFSHLRGIDQSAVEAQLDRLGFDYAAHRLKAVRALSGGMLQKTLLALALASRAPLLLLDEPTANLDPPARRDFLAALKEVGRDVTIVLASHRLSDVRALADRIVVLHRGKVAFDGGVSALEDCMERLWGLEDLLESILASAGELER